MTSQFHIYGDAQVVLDMLEQMTHLKVKEIDGKWYIYMHSTFLETDNKEVLDACLYGMFLAYALLPSHIQNAIKEWKKGIRP